MLNIKIIISYKANFNVKDKVFYKCMYVSFGYF